MVRTVSEIRTASASAARRDVPPPPPRIGERRRHASRVSERCGGQAVNAVLHGTNSTPSLLPPCLCRVPPSYPRPNSVIPALAAGISPCAVPTHLVISPSCLARFSVVPLVGLRTALGLGPRSSLGRRILRAGVGSECGRRRLLRGDSRSGAGMTRKGAAGMTGKEGSRNGGERGGGSDGVRMGGWGGKGGWVLCSARYPRQARV